MVEKLYYLDAYLKEFEASITAIKKNKIFLDRTAFYPGGGGQQNDLGTIDGKTVTDVGKDGDEIFHTIGDHDFEIGRKVNCAINWERRYDLMKGHTGQHILFRSMQEQIPELTVGKVDINTEKKSLFFNGEISWDMLKKALQRANEIIASDIDVRIEEHKPDSKELEKVRIKTGKISGDIVRVIRIGDFDAAACGGVHVKSSGEIGGISIIKIVSGRQASDREIQFDIGMKGLMASSQLAITTISLSNILGCPPDNVEATVRNLRASVDDLTSRLKDVSQNQLESMQPEKIGEFDLYSAMFTGADRKTLNDFASKLIRQPGSVILFCDVSETAFLAVGCNEKISLDCPEFLRLGLDMLKGKGGGKKYFAIGGGQDTSRAEEAFNTVRQAIIDKLTSEFSCG